MVKATAGRYSEGTFMGGSFVCMGVYLLLFLLPSEVAFESYLLLQILGELS
jgi:hypothetical protein